MSEEQTQKPVTAQNKQDPQHKSNQRRADQRESDQRETGKEEQQKPTRSDTKKCC